MRSGRGSTNSRRRHLDSSTPAPSEGPGGAMWGGGGPGRGGRVSSGRARSNTQGKGWGEEGKVTSLGSEGMAFRVRGEGGIKRGISTQHSARHPPAVLPLPPHTHAHTPTHHPPECMTPPRPASQPHHTPAASPGSTSTAGGIKGRGGACRQYHVCHTASRPCRRLRSSSPARSWTLTQPPTRWYCLLAHGRNMHSPSFVTNQHKQGGRQVPLTPPAHAPSTLPARYSCPPAGRGPWPRLTSWLARH